jgi:hypothetical protein
MFGDDLLDSYYQEGLGTKNVHRQLQNYLESYSHKYINLRVLEIGAGLGSATGTCYKKTIYLPRSNSALSRIKKCVFRLKNQERNKY